MSGTLIFVTLLHCPRNEVPMPGACRLFWTLTCLFLFAIALWADDSSSSSTATAPATPPKAKTEVVEDNIHGHKIADPYRWLENSQASDTQQYVHDELAYTRSILDPLPGRAQTHQRLTQLLSIGTIGTPQLGGSFYFYTRREGTQNQPVLFVREGINGKDRTLLDVNQLAADGTVALDWWFPSQDGKLVAYGTSPNGSEISTLRVMETATGKLLPAQIERTRAASLAWLPDNSGFYYTRYPRPGDVPAGQELYNRHVFFHKLEGGSADGLKDPLVFGEGLDPQQWPNVSLSNDGKWLLVNISEGWTKSELYLKNLSSPGGQFVPVASDKNFLYN